MTFFNIDPKCYVKELAQEQFQKIASPAPGLVGNFGFWGGPVKG